MLSTKCDADRPKVLCISHDTGYAGYKNVTKKAVSITHSMTTLLGALDVTNEVNRITLVTPTIVAHIIVLVIADLFAAAVASNTPMRIRFPVVPWIIRWGSQSFGGARDTAPEVYVIKVLIV